MNEKNNTTMKQYYALCLEDMIEIETLMHQAWLKYKGGTLQTRYDAPTKAQIQEIKKRYGSLRTRQMMVNNVLKQNTKRVPLPNQVIKELNQRLDALLAHTWVDSITEARQLIKKGIISVNNKVVTVPSRRINQGDIILVNAVSSPDGKTWQVKIINKRSNLSTTLLGSRLDSLNSQSIQNQVPLSPLSPTSKDIKADLTINTITKRVPILANNTISKASLINKLNIPIWTRSITWKEKENRASPSLILEKEHLKRKLVLKIVQLFELPTPENLARLYKIKRLIETRRKVWTLHS